MKKNTLLIVDPQIDFIRGALPVPGAQAAMENLAVFMRQNNGAYWQKIITCDNHPWNHISFRECGGEWPRHCVAHSQGAAILPDVLACAHETDGPVFVLPKGAMADKEEYSIYASPMAPILSEMLADQDEIHICGIAGDVCVLQTLADGIKKLGAKKFTVLGDFAPSLDGGRALSQFCLREGVCIR